MDHRVVGRRAAARGPPVPVPVAERIDMSDIPEIERIRFFQGELLTADDLTALDDANQELRWLHNRSLHNWGIGFGLDVQGSRGATSVTVNPGYATDIEGHEIILSSSVNLPIPAVSGASTYYLVANYLDDSSEPAEEQRSATACAPGGAVRLSNDPAILWKTIAQINYGVDVVLGEVFIKNCVLSQDSLRRGAPLCEHLRVDILSQGRRRIRAGSRLDHLAARRRKQRLHRSCHYVGGEVPVDSPIYGADCWPPHGRQSGSGNHRSREHRPGIAHGFHAAGGFASRRRRQHPAVRLSGR